MGRKKKCRNLENIQPVLKRSLEEYLPDIMSDEEEMYKLKSIIQNDLQEFEKIIFLAYVELRSFTELSKILGVSRSTCYWIIKSIREKIIKQYKKSI